MTPQEFAEWVPEQVAFHAQNWEWPEGTTRERASELSRAAFENLLPRGLQTEGHFLLVIRCEGTKAGHLWMGPHPEKEDECWIFWIGVDSPFRSRGVATEVLRLAEQIADRKGYRSIGLSTFDTNPKATTLYERAGYTVCARLAGRSQMAKPVELARPATGRVL